MFYQKKLKNLALTAGILCVTLHSLAEASNTFIFHNNTFIPFNEMGVTEEERLSTTLPREQWIKFDQKTEKETDNKTNIIPFISLGKDNVLIFGANNLDNTIDINIEDKIDGGSNGSALVITGGRLTTLNGVNTHHAWTYINNGTLSVQKDASLGAAGSPISMKDGVLTVHGNSTQLHVNRPIKIVDNAMAGFDVPLSFGMSLNREIVGDGCNGLVKTGEGTLFLNGKNSFSGITHILEGTLQVNSNSLPSDVINKGTLAFFQREDGCYGHCISGNGKLDIMGPGIVQLTGDNRLFTGETTISEGQLALNTTIGGNITVRHGGKLSGNGTILGKLTVGKHATIAPGNSIGTIVVLGDYIQNSDTNYLVQINSLGESSLLDITGKAFLYGQVIVESVDGIYNLENVYTILEADGGISGKFDKAIGQQVNGDAALYIPVLTYDANHVFMTLDTSIFTATKTYNQRQVARQLDGITDPTPSQLVVLNKMIGLSQPQARHALNQMSGQQHAADLLVVETINRQFIRRLFDPLRDIVGSDPCIRESYEIDDCCDRCGVDVWLEGSGTYLTQKGGSNTTGFKFDGGEITLGAQKTFDCDLTAGIAASYEYDYIRYHVGGKGSLNSFLGAIYGLYRPACFYILSDLSFSYSTNRIKRPIELGTLKYQTKSTPKISQVTAYGEFGIDYRWEDLLIQPFLGIEAGHYWRTSVHEKGAGDLDLMIKSRKRTGVNSRFGVHLSAPNLPSEFNLYIDLAWICRWTEHSNIMDQRFKTFGTDMCIQGLDLPQNTFEGTVAITKEICECWDFFAEYSGQFWKRSCSYYILGGFQYHW